MSILNNLNFNNFEMSLDSFEYYSQTFHPGKCLLIQTHTHKCCLVGWSPPSQSLLLLLAAKKPRCSNNLSLEHLLYKCVCVCFPWKKRDRRYQRMKHTLICFPGWLNTRFIRSHTIRVMFNAHTLTHGPGTIQIQPQEV